MLHFDLLESDQRDDHFLDAEVQIRAVGTSILSESDAVVGQRPIGQQTHIQLEQTPVLQAVLRSEPLVCVGRHVDQRVLKPLQDGGQSCRVCVQRACRACRAHACGGDGVPGSLANKRLKPLGADLRHMALDQCTAVSIVVCYPRFLRSE
jgi:hypothetical protein